MEHAFKFDKIEKILKLRWRQNKNHVRIKIIGWKNRKLNEITDENNVTNGVIIKRCNTHAPRTCTSLPIKGSGSLDQQTMPRPSQN